MKAGSQINIDFPPSDYSEFFKTFNGRRTELIAGRCRPDYGFAPSEQFKCYAEPGSSRISITLSEDSASVFAGFLISEVPNLDSARRSKRIELTIVGPSGQEIDSTRAAGSRPFTVTAEEDLLQSVSLSNSNKTVGGYGQLTTTLVTKNNIKGGGDVQLVFPKWNADAPESTPKQSFIRNQKCKIVPSPGSTIDAGATCSVTTQPNQDIV